VCGFCGVIGGAETAGIEDIREMTRALAHRGPDDTGTWSSSFSDSGSDYAIALGNTRLAIIDTSSLGHQPMASDSGHVVIAYNGEVYNHRDLRTQLEREGARFRSACDTEVVLEAYRAWGIDALQRFNGMFALAIWDGVKNRLILARDRLGIKPLYYRFASGVLSFGSELGALRAHRAFRPDINRTSLETYLRFGWLTGEEAIYRDTYRLLPGHILIWEAGSISSRSYWRLTDHEPQGHSPDFESIVDELERLLGDAVEARLISDVPLGAFLSGGVDSSTVVALMQERSSRPVRTFSIGFQDEEADEAPYARAIAKHIGTDHTELYVNRKQAREVAQELPHIYDEPFSDPSAVPTVLLSRLTREAVTVALSGDGGDELFGGYRHYEKLNRLLPLMKLPPLLKKALLAVSPWVPSSSIRNGLLKLSRADDEAQLAETFLSGFDEESLRAACGRSGPRVPSPFCEMFQTAPTESVVRRAMYADARTYLSDDILVKVDRATMSVGLEARVPILDHRVVEFAFGLPTSVLAHGGRTKAPLRAVLYRRVPRNLVERPKHGFGFPIRSLLGAELDEWISRYLAPDRLAQEGILDPDAVTQMVSSTRRAGKQAESEIWRLLCFQRWLARNHLGETGE
jgi:asparagine synthase (glutamine-hydrolysing)